MVYNEKQKLCIDSIGQFLSQDTDRFFYLLGYAGTGKTFLISQIINSLLHARKIDHIFVCAPTHQALHVIESYLKLNLSSVEQIDALTRISFLTIHKLLEYHPIIISEDGSKIFKSNGESKILKQMIDKLIVIDECSMISKEMLTELKKYVDSYPIKVILCGDPAQLPPVNEHQSMVFSIIPKNYKYSILLDEIMRTNSLELKEVSMIIRHWNRKDPLNKLLLSVHQKASSFRLYHKKSNYSEATWFQHFLTKLTTGHIPIILTWTNQAANTYNKIIRQHVYQTDDLMTYVVGDYVIFNNYYTSPEDGSHFYTSNMIKIIKNTALEKSLFDWKATMIVAPKNLVDKKFNILVKKISKLDNKFQINMMTVERIYNDMESVIPGKTYLIQTIHRSHLDAYEEYRKDIQKQIEVFYKKFKSETHTKKLWEVYYQHLVDPYAEISYGYSITCHKSQGSTFDTVYVDVNDIAQNSNTEEMQRLLYTAATRCSYELGFII